MVMLLEAIWRRGCSASPVIIGCIACPAAAELLDSPLPDSKGRVGRVPVHVYAPAAVWALYHKVIGAAPEAQLSRPDV